eukprot:77340_1
MDVMNTDQPQIQPELATNHFETLNDDEMKSEEGMQSGSSPIMLSTTIDPNDTDNTLILLDWDDTLFPTSTICDILSKTDGNGMALVRDCQIMLLHKLGVLTLSFLTQLIRQYGANRIHIVTNSLSGWIKDSLSYAVCIAPVYAQIEKLLSDHCITMESAQTMFAEKLEGSTPLVWKRLCFNSILNENEAKAKVYSHVISIGDQWTDHLATKQSIRIHSDKNSTTRPMHHIIKLKTQPNLHDMVNEMLYIQTCFEQLFVKKKITQPVIVDYHREEINHCLNTI